jgi:hypothetical protein
MRRIALLAPRYVLGDLLLAWLQRLALAGWRLVRRR